jgi:hypothetical protein
MKRWIFTLLVSLTLVQYPAFAQTDPPTEVGDQGQTQQSINSTTTTAAREPALVPLSGTEQVRLQLVSCSWWLDCVLAHLFLPASNYINQRQLLFDNSAPSGVKVLNTAVVAQGDLTGYQLFNDSAISIPQNSLSLPANQIVSLPLILNRSAMPPDQYNGKVYLTLANQGERLTLPLTLSVRSGPLIPLVVLFFGVILGRLFKYMQERGEPQAKALRQINQLEEDIARAHLEDRAILLVMTAQVRQLVIREQLEAAAAKAENIRNRLEILNKLRVLETSLEQRVEPIPEDLINQAIHYIQDARRYIAQEEDGKAKEVIEKVNGILEGVGSRSAGTSEMNESARGIATALGNLESQPASFKQPTQLERFQRWLIVLSGTSDRIRAEATFWIVRPLLSLILLVGLSAVGMAALYVENGATFGARPFSDYLGLILWGLSADVASRSLSNLPGLPGQRE